MKRSAHFLAGLFVASLSLASTIHAAPSARETLSREALNASAWATAGLDVTVPPDIRRNLTFLREDLLDEAKSAPPTSAVSYKLGTDLCNALILAIEDHNQTAVKAGYRAAQDRCEHQSRTSPDLEVRRNYMMSWTQYAKEQNQRAEIARQMNNQTALANQQVRVEWANHIAILQRNLDEKYRRYREALRQDPGFQMPHQNFNSANPAWSNPVTATLAPSAAASTAIGIPDNVKELFTPEFRALPEEERFERIAAKMKELNPGLTESFRNLTRTALPSILVCRWSTYGRCAQ